MIDRKSSQHRVLFSKTHELNKEKLIDQIVQPDLTSDGKEKIIAQLRQDLTSTRFHLQSLIEERDARNQELVSANEEIQSANEELLCRRGQLLGEEFPAPGGLR